jgi:hypothetical protein
VTIQVDAHSLAYYVRSSANGKVDTDKYRIHVGRS